MLTLVFAVLKQELKIAMKLLGITKLEEASPDYLNTAELEALLPSRMRSFRNKRNFKQPAKL